MANQNHMEFKVRDAQPDEFREVGQLMVDVYAQLEGFPKLEEQPEYYETLANVGTFTSKPKTRVLVAVDTTGKIGGAVVYFGDMDQYGPYDFPKTQAAAFRLLAVSPAARGKGIGKLLTDHCIATARSEGYSQMIIHSTAAMQIAWKMYERIGFQRSEDLDFSMNGFPVYGFKLAL